MAIITYPHGPLTQLASNLWLVGAKTSQGLDRKMCVVRGARGELFIHDALWLDDATFAALDALGRVETIFVPSWLHDFDGDRYAERYPQANLCGTPGTVKKLKWPRLVAFDPSMAPSCMTLAEIPGVQRNETYVEVRHPEGGASLIYVDALFNIPHRRGLGGLFMRLFGSSGPLHMSRLGKLFLLKDKAAFRRHLEEQGARTDLRHVIVGHGRLISEGAAAEMAAAATRL